MKFQVNLQALEYWFNMIKGAYIFYEVFIKSQILSNKFIKKIREILPYNLRSNNLYAISTKPIYMALNITQTIIYVLYCIFALWPDFSEMLKV